MRPSPRGIELTDSLPASVLIALQPSVTFLTFSKNARSIEAPWNYSSLPASMFGKVINPAVTVLLAESPTI
jgi:hypothetical protein